LRQQRDAAGVLIVAIDRVASDRNQRRRGIGGREGERNSVTQSAFAGAFHDLEGRALAVREGFAPPRRAMRKLLVDRVDVDVIAAHVMVEPLARPAVDQQVLLALVRRRPPRRDEGGDDVGHADPAQGAQHFVGERLPRPGAIEALQVAVGVGESEAGHFYVRGPATRDRERFANDTCSAADFNRYFAVQNEYAGPRVREDRRSTHATPRGRGAARRQMRSK